MAESQARAQKKAALTIAVLSSFLTPFMISSVNVALPAIGDALGADAVMLSWVATSYLLAAAAALVPLGKISDIHGRKKIFILGIGLFTGAALLSAGAGSVWSLIVYRIFQGVGSAMIFATSIAIVTSVFAPRERGWALGITVTAVYTGLSCGPLFGGLLTDWLTWRSLFLFPLPLGVIVILLAVFQLKGEWTDAAGERFDWIGAAVYVAAVLMLLIGASRLPGAAGFGLMGGGAAAFSGFVLWENRMQQPVFEVHLFSGNRVFAFSSLAALLHYSATFAVTFLLSLYLQYILGIAAKIAGLILMAQPVMMALFSPLAGRLSDRFEPRIIASIGMAMTAVGLLLLAGIGKDTSTGFVVAVLLFHGTGFAFFSSPNMNAIMGSVEKRYYGIASGVVGTMRLLGQTFSMGIAAMIFSLLIGRVQITPAVHTEFIQSVNVAFLVFSLLCVAGIFLSLSRGRLHPKGALISGKPE